MRELGIRCITRIKRDTFTDEGEHKIFKNILKRRFSACTRPNQIWCADFTYLKKEDGTHRYNITILDLYDRSPIASINGERITKELAIKALDLTIKQVNRKTRRSLILHTDQGSQFTSSAFRAACKSYGVKQSMSRAGNPYDNAVI